MLRFVKMELQKGHTFESMSQARNTIQNHLSEKGIGGLISFNADKCYIDEGDSSSNHVDALERKDKAIFLNARTVLV